MGIDCRTKGGGCKDKPFCESLISTSSLDKIGLSLITRRVRTSSKSKGLAGRGGVLGQVQDGQCGDMDCCTILSRFFLHRLFAGSVLVLSQAWIFFPVALYNSQCGIIMRIVGSSSRNISSNRAMTGCHSRV